MVKFDQYTYTFKEFCLKTTVHGFYYINSTKGLKSISWCLVLLIMFFFLVWSCTNYLAAYFKFDVETNLAFRSQQQIDFPSITFCPEFGLSKAKISSTLALLGYLTGFTYHSEDVATRFLESQKICNITKIQSPFDLFNEQKLFQEAGVLSVIKQFSWNALNAAKQCWWDNEEIECHGLLVNKVTDTGPCFTYYSRIPNNAEFIGLKTFDNGLNKSLFENRNIRFGGLRNGFRILLDVGQSDKCDTAKKYEGTGYSVYIEDQVNVLTMTEISPLIKLTPGYEIDVIIKPVFFKRNTAHLGYCRLPLYSMFELEPIYFEPLCYYLCLYRMIIDNCKCIVKVTGGVDREVVRKIFGINIEKFGNCNALEMKCVKEQQSLFKSLENMRTKCPICIQACFETKHDTLLTYKKLPSLMNFKLFENNLSTFRKFEEIRKNYLLANFYFNSMEALYVTENQKITFLDVIIYFGGAIGLFVGASYMSIIEILQLLFHLLFPCIQKIGSKNLTSQVILFEKSNKHENKEKINSKGLNKTPKAFHSKNHILKTKHVHKKSEKKSIEC